MLAAHLSGWLHFMAKLPGSKNNNNDNNKYSTLSTKTFNAVFFPFRFSCENLLPSG